MMIALFTVIHFSTATPLHASWSDSASLSRVDDLL
jgi:hypothetical protein